MVATYFCALIVTGIIADFFRDPVFIPLGFAVCDEMWYLFLMVLMEGFPGFLASHYRSYDYSYSCCAQAMQHSAAGSRH